MRNQRRRPMAAMSDPLARAVSLKAFKPFDGYGFADLVTPRSSAAAHPPFHHGVDNPIAQVLRIWLRHPCWPPPSQQVESDHRRFGNPRRDSSQYPNALAGSEAFLIGAATAAGDWMGRFLLPPTE